MSNPTAAPSPAATNRPRMELDNLLRRELKVGDPSDPQQIAQALSQRYQGDTRAQAIEGEARGLPFLNTPMLRTGAPQPPTATNVDLDQAKHDVERDLATLIADNKNKDVLPELEGWQSVIRRSIDEGVAAARQGLDPLRRDTAFAMRRQLGDYARLARLIGVLTPGMNRNFRNLAQSIDESCSVMLVLMGESMANLGFAGGRFLLQAPYSELQARRDAVLNALRQVDGVAAMVGQGATWPRGLRAYRQLSTVLEARGQGDLRSLMNEAELSRTLDELVQLAGGNAPNGLRAIGATAWAPLARLHRFVQTTIRQVSPASPELATLHEALQLFIDGFVPAGGFRLLRVARPSLLNYGLYGPSRISAAELRLIDLVNRRGALARHLDCLTDCKCDEDFVLAQIVLDKVLYDLDRAIDYYCVGDADLGLPEVRAAAFAFLIDAIVNTNPVELTFTSTVATKVGTINIVSPAVPAPWPWAARAGMAQPTFLASPLVVPQAVKDELAAIRALLRPTGLPSWETPLAVYQLNLRQNLDWLGGAPAPLRFVQAMHDELCLQRDNDLQWRSLVEQMTTGCVSADKIFRDAADDSAGCLPKVLDRALGLLSEATAQATDPAELVQPNAGFQVGITCAPLEAVVPPHFEESLESIVANTAP